MEMIKNGIYISKLETIREVKPYTVFEDKDKLLLDINTFGFEQTSTLVGDLKKVLDGKFAYEYEWAGPRISFESMRENTVIRDMIFGNKKLSYKTLDLYKILNDRCVYLSQLTETNLLLKVENAFRRIKLNDKEFIIEKDRYRVNREEQIDFILMPNDILLSVEDFMAQLKVNYNFLKPNSNHPA